MALLVYKVSVNHKINILLMLEFFLKNIFTHEINRKKSSSRLSYKNKSYTYNPLKYKISRLWFQQKLDDHVVDTLGVAVIHFSYVFNEKPPRINES